MGKSTQDKSSLFYIQRIIGLILLLALSAVFFFSAFSKINGNNAWDNFRWQFLDFGFSSITVAGVLARLFIGLELLIGMFLLGHIFLKSITYPATIAILGFFILYLLYLLVTQGNYGSCGCFGDNIAMKPLTAIAKNVIMIAGVIALYYLYPVKPYKNQEWIAMIIAMAALVSPYIMVPLNYDITPPTSVYQPINLDSLYKYQPAPNVDLKKGKHIVAFMSLTCPHCKKAAYLLQIIHREHPDIPIYLVLDGPAEYEQKFFEETHAEHIPHLYFYHTSAFTHMAGTAVPAIFWINNSVIERKATYYQLDPGEMEKWLKQ